MDIVGASINLESCNDDVRAIPASHAAPHRDRCIAGDIYDKEDQKYKDHTARAWKCTYWVIGLLPMFVVFAFIPNENVILMLIGWELMSSVEGLGDLPADIVEYLRGLLQDYTAPGEST